MAGSHYYLTNWIEGSKMISSGSWKDEGAACYVYATQGPGSTPLYRYDKSYHDWFYTISADEGSAAVARDGYMHEFIACYIFDTQITAGGSEKPLTTPLYYLHQPSTDDHFY